MMQKMSVMGLALAAMSLEVEAFAGPKFNMPKQSAEEKAVRKNAKKISSLKKVFGAKRALLAECPAADGGAAPQLTCAEAYAAYAPGYAACVAYEVENVGTGTMNTDVSLRSPVCDDDMCSSKDIMPALQTFGCKDGDDETVAMMALVDQDAKNKKVTCYNANTHYKMEYYTDSDCTKALADDEDFAATGTSRTFDYFADGCNTVKMSAGGMTMVDQMFYTKVIGNDFMLMVSIGNPATGTAAKTCDTAKAVMDGKTADDFTVMQGMEGTRYVVTKDPAMEFTTPDFMSHIQKMEVGACVGPTELTVDMMGKGKDASGNDCASYDGATSENKPMYMKLTKPVPAPAAAAAASSDSAAFGVKPSAFFLSMTALLFAFMQK